MARTKLTLGPPEVIVEHRPDGVILARSPYPVGAYPRAATDWLDHWAAVAPERVFLAERDRGGEAWRKLTYAEARAAARNIAQGLIDRGLGVERPVAILSGNSVDHALIGLGAMIAGVPYAPVSPPYSFVSKDFAKLKAIIAILTPGLLFVDDGAPFSAALDAAAPKEVEVVARANPPLRRRSTAFEALISAKPTGDVDRAQAGVGPDTIAKLLFTSGSTGAPKGVINTHRMITSNQAMLRGVTPSYAAEPPVLIDWLPWSHTFGGNNNFNLVLANGGSFFIDEGRPLPGAIEATAHNLREISPTVYYNVPRGFEMLLPYLDADRELRRSLFARLQAFCYAGAALSPYVREAYERLGLEAAGEIVPMLTSFGSTETGPSAISVTERARDPGVIGIPNPGVEVKLIPNAGKLEARVRSPSITPGYWREPELTKAAFDDEGYYRLGRRAALRRRKRSRTRIPVRRAGGGGF
jgi:feruloyl-CoA synthase